MISDKSLWCALISRKLVIFIRNISLGQCSRLTGWLALPRPICAFKSVSRFSTPLPNSNVLLPDPYHASKSHASLRPHMLPCERWEQSVAANTDSEASATYSYSSFHSQVRGRYEQRIPYISSDSPRESNTARSLGHPSRKTFSAILVKGCLWTLESVGASLLRFGCTWRSEWTLLLGSDQNLPMVSESHR